MRNYTSVNKCSMKFRYPVGVSQRGDETTLAWLNLGQAYAVMRAGVSRALETEAGVGLSATVRPGVLRAVTHLDLTDDDIDQAIERISVALGALERVS